jgi:hypothetical protein
MRFLILLILVPVISFAGDWKYNYSAGTSLYQGDFTRYRKIHTNLLGSHLGFGISKELNDNFDAGLFVHRTSLLSDEMINGYQIRGYSFNGSLFGSSLNLKYFKKRNNYTRVLSFLSFDVEYFYSNSTLNTNITSSEEGGESRKRVSDNSIALGAGVGLGYRINGKYSILWETKTFLTYSDYLDAFSSPNGDGAKDYYLVSYLTLVYRPSKFFIKSKKEKGYVSPKLRRLGCRKH